MKKFNSRQQKEVSRFAFLGGGGPERSSEVSPDEVLKELACQKSCEDRGALGKIVGGGGGSTEAGEARSIAYKNGQKITITQKPGTEGKGLGDVVGHFGGGGRNEYGHTVEQGTEYENGTVKLTTTDSDDEVKGSGGGN